MKLLGKIRIIPLTLFASALILTFKVSDIFNGFSLEDSPLQLTKAFAQEKAPQKEDSASKGNDQPDPAGKKEEPGGTDKDKTKGKDKGKDKGAGINEDNPDNDPTLFTQSEIDLLQDLADRREFLERSAQQIKLREGLLRAAEKRIEKRVSELKQLETTIQGLIKTHDDQQESKMNSLVKIYEAMKPKDAARIFEQLDLDTILIVAERMKERRLAPVMAQMNPERAKDITVKLSKLRELPVPGTLFVK